MTDVEMESMDTSEAGDSVKPPPADVDMKTESEDKDVQVGFSIKWEEGIESQKYTETLMKALQSWSNNNNIKVDFKVLRATADEALIKIQPGSVLSKLLESKGQTLTNRHKKVVTLVSEYNCNTENTEKQVPCIWEPRQEKEQSEMSSPVADPAAEEETYQVPIAHYWYVNHIYKEKIERIEKENGVKIKAQLTVKVEPQKENGDPRKAFSQFTNIVQTSISDSFSIPLKLIAPEAWADILKVLQKDGNKALVMLSSEEMTVCGPGQSQDAISNSVCTKRVSVGEPTGLSSGRPQTIGMICDDPLVVTGIDVDASYWRRMTASFHDQVAKLKAKFDVDLEESSAGQGQVNIKARSRKPKQNKSMESHAIRALVRLYQRSVTTSQKLTDRSSVRDFNSSNNYQPEGASGGAASNGPPSYGKGDTEETMGWGAATGHSQDETCSICLEKFKNKIQLKCKHEFCKSCLEESEKTIGPICALCKDVYDVVEGDQPNGQMTSRKLKSSLKGFPDCGTIVITYVINSGIQTERHPNPGKYYSSIKRDAYLPDNKDGREVLQLLQQAFKQKLIFTVGRSATSGMDNQVTWNDIHHKTSQSGGPEGFGYPDPSYLYRVREELKAKGIK